MGTRSGPLVFRLPRLWQLRKSLLVLPCTKNILVQGRYLDSVYGIYGGTGPITPRSAVQPDLKTVSGVGLVMFALSKRLSPGPCYNEPVMRAKVHSPYLGACRHLPEAPSSKGDADRVTNGVRLPRRISCRALRRRRDPRGLRHPGRLSSRFW